MRKYTQPILYTEVSEEPEGCLPVCRAFAEYTFGYPPEKNELGKGFKIFIGSASPIKPTNRKPKYRR